VDISTSEKLFSNASYAYGSVLSSILLSIAVYSEEEISSSSIQKAKKVLEFHKLVNKGGGRV